MTEAPPVFQARKGAVEAKKADEAARPSYDKVNWLTLKDDGDSIVLRFIDDGDDWLFAKQHTYVPTRNAPADWPEGRTWPQSNGATCRYDEAFGGFYPDCYICDEMRKENGKRYGNGVRLWARAIVRVPVLGTPDMVTESDTVKTKAQARAAGGILEREVGKPVGYADDYLDIDETDAEGKATGKKTRKLHVVVVNYSRRNFFGALQAAHQGYGTVCDRDYQVVRDGTGIDVEYRINALSETPSFDLSDPETREQFFKDNPGLPDMNKLIADRATDEYFQLFFDVRYEQPERKRKDGDDSGDKPAAKSTPKAVSTPAAPKTTDTEVPAADLDAMSARVRARNKRPTEVAEPAATEPENEQDATPVGVGAVNFT